MSNLSRWRFEVYLLTIRQNVFRRMTMYLGSVHPRVAFDGLPRCAAFYGLQRILNIFPIFIRWFQILAYFTRDRTLILSSFLTYDLVSRPLSEENKNCHVLKPRKVLIYAICNMCSLLCQKDIAVFIVDVFPKTILVFITLFLFSTETSSSPSIHPSACYTEQLHYFY